MINNEKNVTQGVSDTIPLFLQNILWYAVETMEVKEKDYLQIFELSEAIKSGRRKQRIIHSQEQPPYKKEYMITTKDFINEKVYIVFNGKCSTMLLASEY